MPVINGVYLKDFTALPSSVTDANIIPIAITGNQIAYRTTVGGIVTDARVTSKLLTGLSITGSAILATDTILQAFGKVQNQINGKQGTITLTTTGTSGPATLLGSTLNIPNYADGGVLSLSPIGAVPNANAATITGTVLNLQPASSSFGGVITTGSQTIAGDKTLTGALIGTTGSFTSNGGSDTFSISHSSGAGIALNITKGGNGEGIYVNKTSGSGNAVTIIGTLNATTLVKSGGTSAQFLKADGTVDSTAYGTGSVTSVAALTLGTTGTDLSSTVANGTTTPVITLNVPDASATARGVVTTGTQTFAGEKTFNNNLIASATAWFSSQGLRKLVAGIDVPFSNSGGTVEFNFGNGGNFTANSLIKSGGTSAQFLKADGTVDSTAYGTGSVTSVAALTLGTTGTDLSSTVANGTTTPVITLNVPDASATARGVVTTGTQTFAGDKTFTGALSGTSASLSSTATASAFIPSGATIPTNGMYLSAANTLDFATNSINRLTITSSGIGIGTTTINQFVNIKSQSTTTSLVGITTSDSNKTLNIGVSSSAGYVMMENAASLILGTSGVTALTIASTGAATFSSSVTDNGTIHAYANKTANYTLTGNDYYIKVTADATITLPTAVGRAGQRYVIRAIGAGVDVTMGSTSSQTINGGSAGGFTLNGSNENAIILFSDGANWFTEVYISGA